MSDRTILKIGHRGACGYEPENTLRSFQKAIDLGVEMIEFDVQLCQTGELVVIHDETVERTTDGRGLVAEMTFRRLRKLDAGQGEKIPTLEEALDLINRKTEVNIELKGRGTAEPVAQAVERYIQERGWLEDDFVISSFDHRELQEFHRLKPRIQLGILFEDPDFDYQALAKELNAVSVNTSLRLVTEKFVFQAHQHNLKVFIYTVNDPEDIGRMIKLGVDGIFSNYPDRL